MRLILVLRLLAVILLVLALSACSGNREDTVSTPEVEDGATAYPGPLSEATVVEAGTAYPAPGSSDAQTLPPAPTGEPVPWDAEPAQGKALLRGILELGSTSVLVGELYLAPLVPTSDPAVELLELDTNTAQTALYDRGTGQFVFRDVAPGRYGIIAWEPMTSAPLNDPETGSTLMVELAAGEVRDVGTLRHP